MQNFLVGGAVRDELLSLRYQERDWVVVGATEKEMLVAGFTRIGKDFPVFLHPETKEEYALARSEKKSGTGYKGFICDTENISLEQDLLRRDLTINAIAKDDNGNIIDPHSGRQDLKDRVLRHVSPAFQEDPLRVLRVCRFAAQLADLGFHIDKKTINLMQQMVDKGMIDELTPERIWQELNKALSTSSPHIFIENLRLVGALRVILPEIDNLFGVVQPKEHHPEIDTGIHTLMALQQAAKLSQNTQVRFAALTHDVGKALTTAEILPQHIGHEESGVPLVAQICDRLKAPKKYKKIATLVCKYHLYYHRTLELKPKTLHKLFSALDAWRNPENLHLFVLASEADSRGRPGHEDKKIIKSDYLLSAYEYCTMTKPDLKDCPGLAAAKVIEEHIIQRLTAYVAQYR